MTARHADLDAMHRLLRRHEWSDIDDWVRAIGALADLSDAEIEQVAADPRGAANGTTERLQEDGEDVGAK